MTTLGVEEIDQAKVAGRARRVASTTGFLSALLKKRAAVICAAIVLVIVVGSLLARVIAPYGPTDSDFTHVLRGPSLHHLLGSDALGRDVLSRLLHGGDASLLGIVETLVTAVLLGIPLGLMAGYKGGWFDQLVARGIDVILAIPGIIILLMVLAIFSHNMTAAMVALGVLFAPSLARVSRGVAIDVRKDLYVEAAVVSGFGTAHIVRRHILPRVAGPLVVQVSVLSGIALIAETGIAYLGLGVEPPSPTWGGSLADGSSVVIQQPWLIIPPGALVTVLIICMMTLGSGVRDALTERWTGAGMGARGGRRRGTRSVSIDIGGDEAATDATGVDALLSVEDLAVGFDSGTGVVPVVSRVSLTIRAGEILGVVGESGSGKTVTGLAVLGLLPGGARILSGHIYYSGSEITHLPRGQRAALRGSEFGFVAQEPLAALDPVYKIGRSLGEVVGHHEPEMSPGQRKQRVAELLSMVGLPDVDRVVGSYPHQMSGGMAQRIGIALALAGRPRLLVADEPTTALDVTVQYEILHLLRSLARSHGMALILISHDWGVVSALCDRAVVMYGGEDVEQGEVADLLHSPLHPYTADLLVCDPRHWSGDGRLRMLSGSVPVPGDWPEGCRFAPRCAYHEPACDIAHVSRSPQGECRSVRCIRAHEGVAVRSLHE